MFFSIIFCWFLSYLFTFFLWKILLFLTFMVGSFYNPGKNGWYTLSDLGKKETSFPWRNVDLSHVVRSLARPPNIDLMGLGRIMVKVRTPLLSIKQCHALFSTSVVSMRIVFFCRIVEHIVPLEPNRICPFWPTMTKESNWHTDYFESMEAFHSNWHLSRNNIYVSYSILSW